MQWPGSQDPNAQEQESVAKKLIQAWTTEATAPEILMYEELLIQDVLRKLDTQVGLLCVFFSLYGCVA